ncbi:MAG: RNA polymerase sigma-70 factor [Ferruginibacter sp.]|nr:RNA polymerase sigma-70 factor [Ferruginibacter sp.]
MDNFHTIDDAALLISFKKGNIAAFEEIYNRYWFRLYSVALKQTDSKQDAEEMVQTVFERIWKNREQVMINNIGAYLTVSIRNTIIDYFRQKASIKKRKVFLPDESPETNAGEEKLDHHQLISTVEKLLHQLPEKTQTVFRLSRFEEKSVKEIATQLHLSEKAIEYHLSRSLKLLRQHLKGFLSWVF